MAVTGLLVGVLLWLPPRLIQFDEKGRDAEFAKLANNYRSTIAQVLGGIAVIAGLYLTARNVFAAEQTRWTKTFSDSVGQLGATGTNGEPLLSIRVGAIYSMERLSRDSPRDAMMISNVLLQYVQNRATLAAAREFPTASTSPYLPDCEASLAVLGAIRARASTGRNLKLVLLDSFLPNLILTGKQLIGFHFKKVEFSGSHFDGGNLFELMFEDSTLEGCSFAESKLSSLEINLCRGQGASFSAASMKRSKILSSNFLECDFTHAKLQESQFSDSDLTGSDFSNSNLEASVVSNCILSNVRFDNANLAKADLRTARGIKMEDLQKARVMPPTNLLPSSWAEEGDGME